MSNDLIKRTWVLEILLFCIYIYIEIVMITMDISGSVIIIIPLFEPYMKTIYSEQDYYQVFCQDNKCFNYFLLFLHLFTYKFLSLKIRYSVIAPPTHTTKAFFLSHLNDSPRSGLISNYSCFKVSWHFFPTLAICLTFSFFVILDSFNYYTTYVNC